MFIVRVDFKNGLHLEFNFANRATGEACRASFPDALRQNKRLSIFDEGGREADIDVTQVQSVQLVSLQEETVSIIRVGLVVDAIRQQLVPERAQAAAQRTQIGAHDVPAGMTGAIGKPAFAS